MLRTGAGGTGVCGLRTGWLVKCRQGTSDLQVADLQVSAVKRVSNCCPISVWAL